MERGLKQRKTNWREWDERLSVKALEARLERTRKLWIVYGDMTETEFRAEREVIEKEIARVRALPEVATIRQCSHRITDVVAAWHDANPARPALPCRKPPRDTWRRCSSPPRRRSRAPLSACTRAGDGARTRDIKLGRLALYQLSYSRVRSAPDYRSRPSIVPSGDLRRRPR